MKIMFCGNDNTGKDYAAAMLGIPYTSSSLMALDAFVWDNWGIAKYANHDECFEDRENHRDVWKTMIRAYSFHDETKLGRLIFANNDIYVGIRSATEFNALKEAEVFDLSMWLDSSAWSPASPTESNEITPDMCDWIINNNGTKEELAMEMKVVKRRLESWRAIPYGR